MIGGDLALLPARPVQEAFGYFPLPKILKMLAKVIPRLWLLKIVPIAFRFFDPSAALLLVAGDAQGQA